MEAGVWTANIWSGERDKGRSGRRPGDGTVRQSDPLTDVQEVKQPVAEIKTRHGGVSDFAIWVINVCGEQRAVSTGEEQQVSKNGEMGHRYRTVF